VHRDVDRRHVVATTRRRTAHPLADVQHRRLVPPPLADDDPPVELDLLHRPAHGLGRGGVGLVAGTATHEPGRIDRRRLGHPDHLEREQLFHSNLVGDAQPARSKGGREHRRARTARCVSLGAARPTNRAWRISVSYQCRKCRLPVNTMARWWRSATSIAISSRIEPPGWMIAVTPAAAAIWIPSGNGK